MLILLVRVGEFEIVINNLLFIVVDVLNNNMLILVV